MYGPLAGVTVAGINAVMGCFVLRNDSAGSTAFQPTYRIGTSLHNGPIQTVGSTTYNGYMDIQGLDPTTGLAWTLAGVNALLVGGVGPVRVG